MDRFTIGKEEYKAISKIKKRQDKANLCLSIMEFMFDDKEPESLSEVAEMVFGIIRTTLQKSKNNSGRGGRPKKENGYKSVLKNENRIETDLKPIENRIETERETVPNEKESTKEKETTLERENTLRKKERKDIYILSNKGDGCDFSAMTDEELVAWGEENETDFEDELSAELFFAWNEEYEKRSQQGDKWKGKISNLSRLKSHNEIMQGYGLSNIVCDKMREFLRQCYLNKHLVSNDKLDNMLCRLNEAYDDDNGKVECIDRAIRGGYLDIRA